MNISAFAFGTSSARAILRWLAAAAALALISSPVRAEQAAVEVVRQYQAALIAAMQQGGAYEARYKSLQGPVTKAFDLAFIAQRAAGPGSSPVLHEQSV